MQNLRLCPTGFQDLQEIKRSYRFLNRHEQRVFACSRIWLEIRCSSGAAIWWSLADFKRFPFWGLNRIGWRIDRGFGSTFQRMQGRFTFQNYPRSEDLCVRDWGIAAAVRLQVRAHFVAYSYSTSFRLWLAYFVLYYGSINLCSLDLNI